MEHTYCVRGALQQEIDGSVYIFIAVMKGYHTLILSLSSDLNQLWKSQHRKKKEEEENKHS